MFVKSMVSVFIICSVLRHGCEVLCSLVFSAGGTPLNDLWPRHVLMLCGLLAQLTPLLGAGPLNLPRSVPQVSVTDQESSNWLSNPRLKG